MTRKEQLYQLVSVHSADEGIREKYTAHLCELLDVVDGSRISEAYCRAAAEDDYIQILGFAGRESMANHIAGDFFRADDKAAIPMSGEITSLNVSVASAVLMYEAVRQRLGK